MNNFRAHKEDEFLREEARKIIARRTEHGLSKNEGKEFKKITSIGTERNFRQCLINYLFWCLLNSVSRDFRVNKKEIIKYLNERSEWVKQKTLDQERQALAFIFMQKLPFVKSLQDSIYSRRSYTLQQLEIIVAHQNERNSISSLLSFFSGLRAHELATLIPVVEAALRLTDQRDWNSNRFLGLRSYIRYYVTGKGGLIREVAIPCWLSQRLEARRREQPKKISDREVTYISLYDIGIGQSWSQSFSSASQKTLGFSRGAHGLRHSYAKWRLAMLIQSIEDRGLNDGQSSVESLALLILSQELGHFRLDVTYAYLR